MVFSADVRVPLTADISSCATAASEAVAMLPTVKASCADDGAKTVSHQKIVKTEGRNFPVQYDKCTLFFYIGTFCLIAGLCSAFNAYSLRGRFWSGSYFWIVVCIWVVSMICVAWFSLKAFITRVVLHKDHVALHYVMGKVMLPFSRINKVALSENWKGVVCVMTCPTASNCNMMLDSLDDGLFEFSLKDRASFLLAMASLVDTDAEEVLLLACPI
eukprot:GEMP01067781.1.p1 GENE.GEMP01067781.1~~GEMP01067781.1.p1  ORF type:complete len:216 (+),score=24.77 GEMP01067781.1:82-729(+)